MDGAQREFFLELVKDSGRSSSLWIMFSRDVSVMQVCSRAVIDWRKWNVAASKTTSGWKQLIGTTEDQHSNVKD